MDFKKINEELKKFDYDDFEVSNDDLSEIEIEKIRKDTMLKNKKRSKRKKLITAASATILVGTICTPAVAENIPVLNEIYEKFGILEGYEDYTTYIGETQENDGYRVTIENLLSTETRMKIAIRIHSEEGIKDNIEFNTYPGRGITSGNLTGGSEVYKIDDHTVILVETFTLAEGKFKRKQTVDIGITAEDKKVPKKYNEFIANFNFKADFKSLENDTTTLKLNNEKGGVIVKELEVTPLGTTLLVNSLEENIQASKIDLIRWPYLILKVDGKDYQSTGGGMYSGEYLYYFDGLSKEVVDNAKSIEFIIVGEEERELEVRVEKANGIEYPVVKEEGEKSLVLEDIEKIGNNLRIIYTGQLANTNNLGGAYLVSMTEEDSRGTYNPISEQVDDKYILEFNNVDVEEEYSLYLPSNKELKELVNIKIK